MDKAEIQNLIRELIAKIDIPVEDISVAEEGKSVCFKVSVAEPHFFTGRDGEALYALNHLVRRMLEGKAGVDREATEFLIDINDFQKKKIDNVRAVAHLMAERARYFKSSVEVDPMSSFERRIIHEFLADQSDVKTESVGTGPTRRVVIRYLGSI
ncbi:MAG: R3H domain-containing nucleic acid-binding protein [Candidatus Paceibacterota bacterium]